MSEDGPHDTTTARPRVDGRAPRVDRFLVPEAVPEPEVWLAMPEAPREPSLAPHGGREHPGSVARQGEPVDGSPIDRAGSCSRSADVADRADDADDGGDQAGRPAVLPVAPCPPFEAAEAPFEWQVLLPGSVGRQVTVRVGADVVDLGGTVIDRADIATARFRLAFENALLRRAASARMRVEVTRNDGTVVKLAARNAASASRASAIVEVVTYLWTVLGDIDGEDRTSVVERVERGGEVAVAGVRFTSIGVAWKRRPILTWSHVGDPTVDQTRVTVPTDDEPIVVPLTVEGAFMLPEVTRVLRARFA